MMDTQALVATVVAVVVAAGLAWLTVRRGRAAGSRPVLLGRMMRRQGIAMDRVAREALGDELAAAARLCARCEAYGECEARLRRRGAPRYGDICPNTALLDELKS